MHRKKVHRKKLEKNTVIIYITGKILHPFKRHSVYKKGYSSAQKRAPRN